MTLPALIDVSAITERLAKIFPAGTPDRENIVRPNTARVVFACIYVGAVEGSSRWFAPRHLYRMTDALASSSNVTTREAFYKKVPRSNADSWYADNSREGARDEGVRKGLIPLNAMILRTDVDTTSSAGRYALAADFAALLSPALVDKELDAAIAAWQSTHLSPAALARAALAAAIPPGGVTIAHPQGGSTVLPYGESPAITKAVVEEFSRRFLTNPAVVWISDSKTKIFANDVLNKVLQIKLDAARLLPDVILVDVEKDIKIVFVEVVASDGPITEQRKAEFLALLADSPRGYQASDALFVTAYKDRSERIAGSAVRQLAWDSFAWFVSEPDFLVQFHGSASRKLRSLS